MPVFSCGMWNLLPWPGMEHGPPAQEMQSLSHWTIKIKITYSLKIRNDDFFLENHSCLLAIAYSTPASALTLISPSKNSTCETNHC